MVAKVFADRPEAQPDERAAASGALIDPEIEAEVQAVAAWFDALPLEWQRYFDGEAQSGRRAYGQA